jgi:hypothetical protein
MLSYSKGQKNDFREAEAIAEVAQCPMMKFVATKTVDQLDLQTMHRVLHHGRPNSLRLGLNRKLDWTCEATKSGDIGDSWTIDPGSWNVHENGCGNTSTASAQLGAGFRPQSARGATYQAAKITYCEQSG